MLQYFNTLGYEKKIGYFHSLYAMFMFQSEAW